MHLRDHDAGLVEQSERKLVKLVVRVGTRARNGRRKAPLLMQHLAKRGETVGEVEGRRTGELERFTLPLIAPTPGGAARPIQRRQLQPVACCRVLEVHVGRQNSAIARPPATLRCPNAPPSEEPRSVRLGQLRARSTAVPRPAAHDGVLPSDASTLHAADRAHQGELIWHARPGAPPAARLGRRRAPRATLSLHPGRRERPQSP